MSTFTPQNKSSATFTPQSKAGNSFLLKQDTFYLLLESGFKIILEPVVGAAWTPANKS